MFRLKLATLLLIALPTICFSAEPIKNQVYIGADGLICKTCFKHNAGARIFKRKTAGSNPFIGINFNKNVSAELGYHYIKSSRVSTPMAGEEIHPGVMIPNIIETVGFKSTILLKGPYLALNLKTDNLPFAPINFFVSVGVSQVKSELKRQTLFIDSTLGITTRTFEKTRTLERFAFGVNYEVSENWQWRAHLTTINASKLESISNNGIAKKLEHKIIPKNMTCYNVGVAWKFN